MKRDNVKSGMQQAPHRSLFNALGMTQEEMKKPLVGIVSSYNEIVPGHMNLDKIADSFSILIKNYRARLFFPFWTGIIVKVFSSFLFKSPFFNAMKTV